MTSPNRRSGPALVARRASRRLRARPRYLRKRGRAALAQSQLGTIATSRHSDRAEIVGVTADAIVGGTGHTCQIRANSVIVRCPEQSSGRGASGVLRSLVSSSCASGPSATGAARRRVSAVNVTHGQPPELEGRGSARHDGSCAANSRSAFSSPVSTTARPYESTSVRTGQNTTTSPRSRYGCQWAAWLFVISRSESVRVWAKFGREAMSAGRRWACADSTQGWRSSRAPRESGAAGRHRGGTRCRTATARAPIPRPFDLIPQELHDSAGAD